MMNTLNIKFNVNDRVRVKLTDRGREIHDEFWCDHPIPLARVYSPPKEDDEGWSEWQLWVLMETFGPELGYILDEPPFEPNIEFKVKEISQIG